MMIATIFYLCPRCFEAADDPTPCPRCGGERAICCPGATDNAARKPLTTSAGEIRNPAPVWWLRATGALDNPHGRQMVAN